MDVDLADRMLELTAYIGSHRDLMVDTWGDWHDRIERAQRLARGEYRITRADSSVEINHPLVSNLADVVPKDVARLVSETTPKIVSPAKDDSRPETMKARTREAIGDTYWDMNDCETLEPLWTIDLEIAGGAFIVLSWGEGSAYPCALRVDPASCFPNIHNGQLQDLLTIQRVPIAIAHRLWPHLGLPTRKLVHGKAMHDMVEILEYHDGHEQLKGVGILGADRKPVANGFSILAYTRHELGVTPADMVKKPSADGTFTGLVDQIQESMQVKDMIVRLSTEYAGQQIHAPFEERGIQNPTDPPGSKTIYHHIPNFDGETFMRRVQPAGSAPQLYALLQLLDEEQRASLSYPASRQGDVSQSIASGAFVDATMGSLSSLVKEDQKLQAKLRRKATEKMFAIDELYLNREKDLCRPVNSKWTYKPGEQIEGRRFIRVNYGAAAGIGPLNADIRLMQYLNTRVIAREDVRDNLDFIPDADATKDKIDREQTDDAIGQRFLTDPQVSLDLVIAVSDLQETKGLSRIEAIKQARAVEMEKMQGVMAQQQADAQAQATLQTAGPPNADVAGAVESQAAGEIPPEAGDAGLESEDIAAGFTPPPFTYVNVR